MQHSTLHSGEDRKQREPCTTKALTENGNLIDSSNFRQQPDYSQFPSVQPDYSHRSFMGRETEIHRGAPSRREDRH